MEKLYSKKRGEVMMCKKLFKAVLPFALSFTMVLSFSGMNVKAKETEAYFATQKKSQTFSRARLLKTFSNPPKSLPNRSTFQQKQFSSSFIKKSQQTRCKEM